MWRYGWLSLVVWVGCCGVLEAQAENWRLRQTAKRRQQQALKRLEQQPFSHEAFVVLWQAVSPKRAKTSLDKALRRGLKKQPKAWWRWVVWGRWNLAQKRCGEALLAWRAAEKLRTDWRVCQGKARAWVCAGEAQRGLEKGQRCLPQIPLKERERAYREWMRLAIHLRADKALADLMRGVVVGQWSRSALLSTARRLLGSGYASYALRVYEVLLRQGKAHSAKDWKEASEAALHAGALQQAKTYLTHAQKGPKGPQWWAWELYGLEERIARRGKTLRALYAQRKIAWSKLPDAEKIRRWDWLARIADELGNREDAALWDQRILSVHPKDVQARLRRLQEAQRQADQTAILKHYDALLQSKRAEPAHIALYVEALAKRSGRPMLGRWKVSWASLYRGLLCYHRQPNLWMHYSTEEHVGEICYRSTKEDWAEYRQRRWDFWSRYEAKEPQKKHYQRAKHILLEGVEQYNGNLEALRLFEPLLVELGEDAEALKVRRRMIALSAGEVEAFVWLEKMLREMGDQAGWSLLVQLHLDDPRWSLRQLGGVLFHLGHVAAEQETSAIKKTKARTIDRFDTPTPSKASQATPSQPMWAHVPCDILLRAVERRTAALTQTAQSMTPKQTLPPTSSPSQRFTGDEEGLWRILVAYASCGGQGEGLRIQKRLEALAWSPQQGSWLLQMYAQMGYIAGVQRIYKRFPSVAPYWERWLAERNASR